MGEQRNLTEENVEQLKQQLDMMKKDNPQLEYRFFSQNEEPQNDTEDIITIVKEIREKLNSFDRKFNLVFGNHVLMDGKFRTI